MKTAVTAIMLSCTAVAFSQSIPHAEPPVVKENYSSPTYPRFDTKPVKPVDFTYAPAYKNVKPPIEGVDVGRSHYKISAEKNSTVRHPSGTAIHIPASAFVDDEGNAIMGEVVIDYREFKNPLDFILSGIPMSYNDSEGKSQFVSAGMFEINASAGGKKVFLKEGQQIKIEFASMDKKPDYNLYAFNDESGKWEERIGSAGIPVSEKTKYNYSSAIYRYQTIISGNRTSVYDSTTFNSRFEDPNYFFTKKNQKEKFSMNRWYYGDKSYRSLIKIVGARKAKDRSIVFKIARAVSVTHPELSPYYHVSWKLKSNIPFSEFHSLTNFKNCFSDIRIEKEGDNYLLRMKGLNGYVELEAEPVRVGKDYKVKAFSQKTKDRMFKSYSRMLGWREKRFNKELEKGWLSENRIEIKPEDVPEFAWNGSKKFMTEEELKMDFDEWEKYVKAQQEVEKNAVNASTAGSSAIIRSFTIDGMGIWNCDQIKRLDNPVTVLASYEDKSGKPFAASQTFIINKKINGVLQYYNNEVSFSKSSDNIMIAVGENGEIAYLTAEELRQGKYRNQNPYTFSMNEPSEKTTSVAELKIALGL